ncbi:hypothetical protein D9M71_547860 [compost metagenome]
MFFHPQYQATTVEPCEKLVHQPLNSLRADTRQALAVDAERRSHRCQLAESGKLQCCGGLWQAATDTLQGANLRQQPACLAQGPEADRLRRPVAQLLAQVWIKLQVIATTEDQHIERLCLIQSCGGGCDAVAGVQLLPFQAQHLPLANRVPCQPVGQAQWLQCIGQGVHIEGFHQPEANTQHRRLWPLGFSQLLALAGACGADSNLEHVKNTDSHRRSPCRFRGVRNSPDCRHQEPSECVRFRPLSARHYQRRAGCVARTKPRTFQSQCRCTTTIDRTLRS